MVVFHFGVAKVRPAPFGFADKPGGGAARKGEMYLQFNAPGAEVFNGQATLVMMAFPLGPEAVQPKEVMASEVSGFGGKLFQ